MIAAPLLFIERWISGSDTTHSPDYLPKVYRYTALAHATDKHLAGALGHGKIFFSRVGDKRVWELSRASTVCSHAGEESVFALSDEESFAFRADEWRKRYARDSAEPAKSWAVAFHRKAWAAVPKQPELVQSV